MREFLATVGPALDLLGWVTLFGAVTFFAWAWLAGRGMRHWRVAVARVATMDGERCVVWEASDGAPVTRRLAEDQLPGVGDGEAATVYQRGTGRMHWRTTPPENHAGLLRVIGWAMFGLAVAANALGLLDAALLDGV